MKQRSDWRETRSAAIGCKAIGLLLLTLTAACGPRDVPLPPEMRPDSAGADEAGRGGRSGASGSSGGSGGTAAAPSGGRSGTAGISADGGVTNPAQGGAGGSGTGTGVPFYAGDDPNRNHVQPGGLCARLALIQCAAEAHCCLQPGRTPQDCETSIRASCNDQLYLDQIAGNAITGFDAAIAADTYMELENRSAACDVGIGAWGLVALRSILKGTRAPNQSCKPPGTAALNDKPAQAAALASCASHEQYACLPMSLLGDWTCAAKSGSGANCVTDDNCQTGLYCHNPNMQPLGKCAQRLQLAASCVNGTDCASLYCKGGKCVAADQQVAFCLK